MEENECPVYSVHMDGSFDGHKVKGKTSHLIFGLATCHQQPRPTCSLGTAAHVLRSQRMIFSIHNSYKSRHVPRTSFVLD